MRYFLIAFSIFIFSCNPQKDKIQAENIIDKTIIYSGTNRVTNSKISFNFRGEHFSAIRKKGNFTLSRHFDATPHGLHDAAVKKKLLSNATIKGKKYFKIQITFDRNGGGEDHQDVFIYWIGKKDYLIDYFAYSYEVNGGGIRFRASKNERYRSGIRFLDYNNYKPKDNNISLENLDKAFENNELELVSEIILKNVKVVPFY